MSPKIPTSASSLRYWPYLLLALLILFVNQFYLTHGLPLTHDGHHHLARMANYYLAVKEGQLPPRWAGNLNNTFGYPVFNFNYPLPNILALPLQLFNMSYETMFKRLTLLAVITAGWGMYWLMFKTTKKTSISLFTASLYVFNPYIINLIYSRGTIGELLALAIMPWLLGMIKNYKFNLFYWLATSLLTAALLLAHNIFVLIASPLIVLLVFQQLLTSKSAKKLHQSVLAPLAVGASCSLFFWLPALLEKGYTILDSVPLSQEYPQHFPTLSQLLFSPVQFGFSTIGPVDSLSLSPGLLQLMLLVLATLYISKQIVFSKDWQKVKAQSFFILMIVMGWLYLILQLPFTKPIWDHISLLHYAQFPWRLSSLVILTTSIVGGLLVLKLRVNQKFLWLGILLIVLLSKRVSVNPDTFAYTDEYWLNYPLTTSLADENMPVNFNKNYNHLELAPTLFSNGPVAATPSAISLDINKWKGSVHTYTISADQPIRIIERTAYFPGWEVIANGQSIEIISDDANYPGLISYNLEPGDYQIKTRFTQKTPARIVGNSLSLLGLIMIILVSYKLHTAHEVNS